MSVVILDDSKRRLIRDPLSELSNPDERSDPMNDER